MRRLHRVHDGLGDAGVYGGDDGGRAGRTADVRAGGGHRVHVGVPVAVDLGDAGQTAAHHVETEVPAGSRAWQQADAVRAVEGAGEGVEAAGRRRQGGRRRHRLPADPQRQQEGARHVDGARQRLGERCRRRPKRRRRQLVVDAQQAVLVHRRLLRRAAAATVRHDVLDDEREEAVEEALDDGDDVRPALAAVTVALRHVRRQVGEEPADERTALARRHLGVDVVEEARRRVLSAHQQLQEVTWNIDTRYNRATSFSRW